MEEIEMSFLEDWKNVIKELKELGLISEKHIKTSLGREPFAQPRLVYCHQKMNGYSENLKLYRNRIHSFDGKYCFTYAIRLISLQNHLRKPCKKRI